MRLLTHRAVTTALAVGLCGSLLGVADAAQPKASSGSAGVGDPYYPRAGNGGYQVSHYDIDVAYSVAARRIAGTTTLTARSTQALSRFNVDLALPATAVRVDGVAASFTQRGAEVVITPAEVWTKGRRAEIEVSYSGKPGAAPTAASVQPGTRGQRAPSSSASRARHRCGSPATTTRPTKRPTTSRSRCLKAPRRSASEVSCRAPPLPARPLGGGG